MFRLPLFPALAGILMSAAILPAAPAAVSPGESGPTEYAVEIVVFEYLHPDDGGEIGSSEASLAGFEPPPPDTAVNADVIPLPRDQLQLTPEANTFRRSRNYRLLLHTGWRQQLQERMHAKPVYLRYPEANGASADAPDKRPWTSSPYPQPAVLEGTVTVALERYLHLSVDLVFRPDATQPDMQSGDVFRDPQSAGAEPAGPTSVFRMVETRRMRSGERHYFDHPRIGVITLITAYEAAADEAPRDTGVSADN